MADPNNPITPQPGMTPEQAWGLFDHQMENTPPGQNKLLDDYRAEKTKGAMLEHGLDPDQHTTSPWTLMRPDLPKQTLKALARGGMEAWNGTFRFGANAVNWGRNKLGLGAWDTPEERRARTEQFAKPLDAQHFKADENDPVLKAVGLAGAPLTFTPEAKDRLAGPSEGGIFGILESLTEHGTEFLLAGGVVKAATKAGPALIAKQTAKLAGKGVAPAFAAEASAAVAGTLASGAARLEKSWLAAGALQGGLKAALFDDPYAKRVSSFIAEAPPDLGTPLLNWINTPIIKGTADALAPDALDPYGKAQMKSLLEDYLLGMPFAVAGVVLGATIKKVSKGVEQGTLSEGTARALLEEAEKDYAAEIAAASAKKALDPAHVVETADGMFMVVKKAPQIEGEFTIKPDAPEAPVKPLALGDGKETAEAAVKPEDAWRSKMQEELRTAMAGPVDASAAFKDVPFPTPKRALTKEDLKAMSEAPSAKATHGDYEVSGRVDGTGGYSVSVYGKDGERVGWVSFEMVKDPDTGSFVALRPDMVHVEPAHRRKGVATAMYDLASKETGLGTIPGKEHYPEGLAFAKNRYGLNDGAPASTPETLAPVAATGGAGGKPPSDVPPPPAAAEPSKMPKDIPGPRFASKTEAETAAGAINMHHEAAAEASLPIDKEKLDAIRKRFAEVYNSGKGDPDPRAVVEILEEYGINKRYLTSPADSISLIKAMVDVAGDASHALRAKPTGWAQTIEAAKAAFPSLKAEKLEPVLKKLGIELEQAPAVMTAARAYMVMQHREVKKLTALMDKYPGNEALEDMVLKAMNNLSVIHAEFTGANASVGRTLQVNQMDSKLLNKEFRKNFNKGKGSTKGAKQAAAKDAEQAAEAGPGTELAVRGEDGMVPHGTADAPPGGHGDDVIDAEFWEIGDRKLLRGEALDLARIASLSGDESVEGVMKVIAGPTMKEIEVAAEAMKPSLMKRFLGARVEFMLSGFSTHVVNIASNAFKLASSPAELAWYGVSRADKEALHQSWDLFAGQLMASFDGLQYAARSFSKGQPIIDPGNVVWEKAGNYGLKSLNEGLTQSGPWGAVETLYRMPGRFMTAGDEFFSQVNYRARTRMDIMANIRGRIERGEINPTKEEVADLTDRLLKASVDEGSGRGIYTTGLDHAREGTYKTDLTGSAKAFQNMVNAHPILQFHFPFVRAPANVFDFVWQSTPGLNVLNKRMREAIEGGGVEAKRAIARAEVGAAMYGVAAYYAASGKITGAGPQDPNVRRTWESMGNKPYTLTLDDGTRISYRRADPFLSSLGIMADFWAASGDLEESDRNGMAASLVSAFASNAMNKSYMSNVDTFLRAISSNNPEYAQRLARSDSGSFVPSVVKDMNDDPYEREVQTIWDAIAARTPGYSRDLEPRFNLLGEPIMRPSGFWNRAANPMTVYGPIANDRVAEELAKLGRSIPGLPTATASGNVNLMDRDYFGLDSLGKGDTPANAMKGKSPYTRWHELMADPGNGMPSLRKQLEDIILSPTWDALTDSNAYEPGGQKFQLASRIIMTQREIAWFKLLEEYPSLQQAMDEERSVQMEGIMGVDSARRKAKELRDLGGLIHRNR